MYSSLYLPVDYIDAEDSEDRICGCVSLWDLMCKYEDVIDIIEGCCMKIGSDKVVKRIQTCFMCKQINVDYIRRLISSFACQPT